MSISEITGQGPLQPSIKKKKVNETPAPSRAAGDKLELSAEARTLSATGRQKQLEEVQQKIHDKFYFRPDVTEKVVDAIIHDLMK